MAASSGCGSGSSERSSAQLLRTVPARAPPAAPLAGLKPRLVSQQHSSEPGLPSRHACQIIPPRLGLSSRPPQDRSRPPPRPCSERALLRAHRSAPSARSGGRMALAGSVLRQRAPCSSGRSSSGLPASGSIGSSSMAPRRGLSRASTVRVAARRGRGDRRRPPPPDLPSLLFDQRIVYLGMPVRGAAEAEGSHWGRGQIARAHCLAAAAAAQSLTRFLPPPRAPPPPPAAGARRHGADGRGAAVPGEAGREHADRDAHQQLGHDAAGRRNREPRRRREHHANGSATASQFWRQA